MKRKTLTTAIMAGLTGAAGMVSVANAVNVNPDGLGQVLLYPYYTARGGNDTLISVVNTTSVGKAVKIRFLEALNSREVLDFNIYLSEFDVWTAAITDLDALDRGEGFGIITADTTCTAPYIFGDRDGSQDFIDFGYTLTEDDTAGQPTFDGGPQGIERTASGYIEIIEMGTLIDREDDGLVDGWITHDSSGVPDDCDSVVDLWRAPADDADTAGGGEIGTWNSDVGGDPTFSFDTTTATGGSTGGLFGSATILNVNEGTLFSYDATAIDGFWPAGLAGINHENPGNVNPSLQDSPITTSNVFVDGQVETIDWGVGSNIQALNATLTLDQLLNDYNINAELNATTEWVLTFPTKRFHVDAAEGGPQLGSTEPVAPFSELWTEDDPNSCDELSFSFWDREEQVPVDEPGDPGGVEVSPPGPIGEEQQEPGFFVCREANVIRFGREGTPLPDATEILREPLRPDTDDSVADSDVDELSYTNIGLPEGWNSGWVRFNFGSDFQSESGIRRSDDAQVVVEGLPVIGFGVTTYTNGTLEGGSVLANYGGSFKHRGTRSTVPAPDTDPDPAP
jgi:hypothetical protein